MENDRREQEVRALRRLGFPLRVQFSLFELFAILLFAGVGAAALRGGGNVALILVQAALWLFVGVALLALVARGAWQAFAIGFVLGVAGYGLPALYVGQSEMDPYEARLPLSKALLPVWHAVVRDVYREPQSDDEFEASEVTLMQVDGSGNIAPAFSPAAQSMGPYTSVRYVTADGRTVDRYEKPPRHEFMLVAHALLAIAIGYAFGKIAEVVYHRRLLSAQERPSSESA